METVATTSGLRIGIKLFGQARAIDDLRHVWLVADEGGFDHCWVSDHFAAVGDEPSLDVFEAWALLGAMSQLTSRVRVGCLVTGNTFRHPAVLAKTAVTVDHLSGGRLEFGIGAAWFQAEHEMLGIDFGTPGQRVARLREACQILKLLWTEDRPSFDGASYRLRDAAASPRPVQRPHPPIWIGATGEKKALRIVAEYGDVWNAPGPEPTEFRRLSKILDDHCARIERDPGTIRRSVQFRFEGRVTETLETAHAYAQAGAQDLVLVLMGTDHALQAEQVAGLLPRLRELG
jgi:F420-dependent oxidoreductase-like protein